MATRDRLNTLTVGKKLTFSFVLLVLVCGAFEASMRLLPGKQVDLALVTGRKKPSLEAIRSSKWAERDAFCAYRAKPGNYGSGKTVNKDGYISTPDVPYEKDPHEIRIVFLGGSSTAGTGHNLADNETWPWKTQLLLQKKWPGQKVTFLNGALSGYTSFESYGRFWSRLRFYQPDIVVAFHAWNEMYYFKDARDVRNWRTNVAGWENFAINPTSQLIEPHWLDTYFQYSQLLSRARLKFGTPAPRETGENPWIDPSIPIQDTFDPAAVEVWRYNLRLLKGACEQSKARLFVCKQCTLIARDTPEEDRKRCRVDFHGMSYDAHLKAFDAIYNVIDEEIPRDQVIDTTTLSGRPELFYDQIHQTEAGTTEIASIVAAALFERYSVRE